MAEARFHDLTVSTVTQEGRDGVCLTLDVPAALEGDFDFEPGQYLTLRADVGGADIRRPYSICSAPGGALQVGIKRVEDGRFSTYASGLSGGETLQVMPPDGRFTAPIGGAVRYLLIAAGSGITPMLAIAEAALAGHPEAEVTLVYGNRDTGAIMFMDRLSDLKDRHLGRFRVVHLLSREAQDVDLFNGRIDPGKLDELARAGLIAPAEMDGIFLCGPGTMIDAAELSFGMMGVPAERIHAERFLPADGQAPRAVSAEVRDAVAEGVEVETILDGSRKSFRISDPEELVLTAAQAAGVELPYACANGMCCTCRCKVTEGSAEMVVNYSLEPWEEEAGYTLACQARATSAKLVLDFDAV
ncbi:MAG: 2Fe-2S iron-sulfur cluster-binding protein [Pseudomonadota bacterium]